MGRSSRKDESSHPGQERRKPPDVYVYIYITARYFEREREKQTRRMFS